MKAEIYFIISVAIVYEKFLKRFQKTEPLIHVLFEEARTVALTLAGIFANTQNVNIYKIESVLEDRKTFLPIQQIVCGEDTKLALKGVNEKLKMEFLHGCQSHYISSCKYILLKMPKSCIMKFFRCI